MKRTNDFRCLKINVIWVCASNQLEIVVRVSKRKFMLCFKNSQSGIFLVWFLNKACSKEREIFHIESEVYNQMMNFKVFISKEWIFESSNRIKNHMFKNRGIGSWLFTTTFVRIFSALRWSEHSYEVHAYLYIHTKIQILSFIYIYI